MHFLVKQGVIVPFLLELAGGLNCMKGFKVGPYQLQMAINDHIDG